MAAPIEDVGDLPGQTVSDQEGQKIGEVKEIYAVGEGEPMWVTVEASTGMAGSKIVFIPLARMKSEDEEIRVPYSSEHIKKSPEVEPGDELSEEDDRKLRDYYAIDHADQELRSDNASYATLVPEAEGAPQKTSGDDIKEPELKDEDDEEEPKGDGDSEDEEENSEGEKETKGQGEEKDKGSGDEDAGEKDEGEDSEEQRDEDSEG